MPDIRTVADLRRALTPGTVAIASEHAVPALNGSRTVVKADTTGVCLSLPAEHPQAASNPQGSFLAWPKRAAVTFPGGPVAAIAYPDGTSLVTLAVEVSQGPGK